MSDILVPPITANDASPYAIVPKVINASWNYGLQKAADYQQAIDDLKLEIDNLLATPGTNHVAAGTAGAAGISEPTITIPTGVTPSTLFADFQTQYMDLVNLLDTKFTAFRATYFPNEQALYAQAEQMLNDALTNDSYIPASTQLQIWGDDHARITADRQRAQANLDHLYSGKRFPLPPGELASAQMQLEQKAQDELAESSRKIAIMSVEQYKWTIEKCISLRTVALQMAVDYIKALASGPETASHVLGIGYDAESKFIAAVSQWYNARIDAAKVTNQVAQYNNSTTLEADVKNQMADLTLFGEKVAAIKAEAATLAQMATSLFNNIHTQAGISGSSSNSVGYNYSNDTASAAPTITGV